MTLNYCNPTVLYTGYLVIVVSSLTTLYLLPNGVGGSSVLMNALILSSVLYVCCGRPEAILDIPEVEDEIIPQVVLNANNNEQQV
jgi:hypothetical protein